jgi:hypothetical protein
MSLIPGYLWRQGMHMGGVLWPSSWLAAVEAHLRAARWPWTAGIAARTLLRAAIDPAAAGSCAGPAVNTMLKS